MKFSLTRMSGGAGLEKKQHRDSNANQTRLLFFVANIIDQIPPAYFPHFFFFSSPLPSLSSFYLFSSGFLF